MEWSADGAHLIFVSDRDNRTHVLRQAASGVGSPEVLVDSSDGLKNVVPSSDGSALLINRFFNNLSSVWSKSGKDKMVLFASGSYWIGQARFSPDGHQVAYSSYESGVSEVYVRPFAGTGVPMQVSAGGGWEPVWSRDGRRLFYVAGRRMMVATMAPPPGMRVLSRDSLFTGDGFGNFDGATYDVAPDGKHFLMVQTDARNVQLVIALGWASTLRARMAGR